MKNLKLNEVMRRLPLYILTMLFFAFGNQHAQAQLLVNEANLINYGNTNINIHGSLHLSANGILHNGSNIYISENFYNNSGGEGFIDIASGKVEFFGENQIIGGNDETFFNHLAFTGTGVKILENNIFIRETLDISDREVATEENTLHVLNTDANSVISNGGYVSSTGDGRFARNMESVNDYDFPLGSAVNTERYRPLTIKPTTSDFMTFHARMVNNIPTTDGFDIAMKDDTISAINENWYHLINQTESNEAVNITFYFDQTEDNTFDGVAQWNVTDGWLPTSEASVNLNPSPNFSAISITDWDDFSTEPFALFIQKRENPINSIEENELYNVRFYPNPVSESLMVEIDETLLQSTLTVYEVTGKKVKTLVLNNLENSINLTEFPKGVYLLNISKETHSLNKRIVVQ
ncbi:MAG: T9SS C-terminal target domain-containing protein [Chitinophagaceae bacterium]|nr:MAG: T9SS C-terminal target domain-containing protein [Chitinophagaceae bacterium]